MDVMKDDLTGRNKQSGCIKDCQNLQEGGNLSITDIYFEHFCKHL